MPVTNARILGLGINFPVSYASTGSVKRKHFPYKKVIRLHWNCSLEHISICEGFYLRTPNGFEVYVEDSHSQTPNN